MILRDGPLERFLGRSRDRRMQRPPGLAFWLDGEPPFPVALGLALQHLAVQSVYFVLPAAVGAAVTQDPAQVTRFLSLSILAAALWQALQIITRGPSGSGYPIPGTHTAALLGAYLVAAQAGSGFGGIGALVLLVGIASVALTFVLQRMRVFIPNEVAGVVVFLIGVALITLGTQQLGLQSLAAAPSGAAVAVVLASLAVMVVAALSRTAAARFAVIIGALVGVALALLLGETPAGAAQVLAGSPWLALPEPWLPDPGAVTPAALLAALLALVAMKATAAGSIVVIQRAADAGWTRPDAPPLRRGLLANGVAVAAAGLFGGAAPGPNTAALGLSIATGTLARRIVWLGVPLLVVLALCPKLVALFVLMPGPVKAAMLFYVSGFIMAQGCQLVTARLLDTRRTLIVAFGLTAGIAVAVAPQVFQQVLPALASPLAFGAMVAFLANLVTLPLVAQRAERRLAPGPGAAREAAEWFAGLAGAWGLKPGTARAAEHALGELAELLAGRGVTEIGLSARRAEDRVELALAWQGAPLPERARSVRPEDLLGPLEAQERFAVWLATRDAQSVTQSAVADGQMLRLVFED
ncbi:solute carrier family 23 protein [Paracraurococcus ruber]|nr:solute carrier family 23 protein [Paracraurococcus ruber]